MIVSSLLILCFPAFAGHYEADPTTGGTWTLSPADYAEGDPSGDFYNLTDSNGGYGCQVSIQAENSKATLSGTIKTVFHWVPTPGDSGDVAPQQVVVTETCSVSGGGLSYYIYEGDLPPSEGEHEADNGLGSTSVSSSAIYFYGAFMAYGSTSAGTRAKVMSGGDTVTLTCTVSAKGTSRDNVSHVGARYSASISPIAVNLVGVTLDNGAMKVLTGQQVRAVFYPGGYPIVSGTQKWQEPGASPFREFVVNTGGGQRYALDQSDKEASLFRFFTAAQGDAKVTCTATVQLPDGNGGTSDESITGTSRSLQSVKPTMDWEVQSHDTRFDIDPPTGPTHASYFSPFYLGLSGTHDGQRWVVSTNVPAPFTGGTGCFSQLITPGRYATFQALNQEIDLLGEYADGSPGNGTEAYDGGFPNNPWSVLGLGIYGDSPQQPTRSADMAQSRAGDSFHTWAMYQPTSVAGLPTSWVPVQEYSWNWGGTAQHIKIGANWTADWNLVSHYGATPTSSPTDTDIFPKWQYYINDLLATEE